MLEAYWSQLSIGHWIPCAVSQYIFPHSPTSAHCGAIPGKLPSPIRSALGRPV